LITSLAIVFVLRTQGQIDLRQKIEAFLIGIPGTGFFFGFWTIGETVLPAGEASVLIYTFPIWTLILSLPILGDRPTPLKVGAALLGFAGVALVARVGTTSLTGDLVAISLLIVAGFAFALDNVLFKRLFKGDQLLRANVWQLAGGSAFLTAWASLSEPVTAIHWTPALAGAIFWIGVLGTAIVFVLWFTLLSHYNAASLTAYTFLVVVVALVGSFFILGQTINEVQLAGVLALIVSIYLISKVEKHSTRLYALES
jgi:drug/metabolite transporter (DMT)-like permease